MGAPGATRSPAQLAYAAACESYVRHGAQTHELLALAATLDRSAPEPTFVRGILACTLASPDALAAAREALARGAVLALSTAHQRGLRDALGALCAGELGAALCALEGAAQALPSCLLTAKLHHAIAFMAGEGEAMLAGARAARSRAAVPADACGTLLGFEAFARGERGEHATAALLAERAVHSAPEDPWAFHALLHALEETGQSARGLALAGSARGRFPGRSNFIAHLAWHEGLFALAEGEPEHALAIYDRHVRGALGVDYRDGINCVALLVRLAQAGVQVDGRFRALTDWARRHADTPSLALADLHALIALLRAGERALARQLVTRLATGPAPGEHGAVQRDVGAELGHALLTGEPRVLARALDRIGPALARLGGSRVQRAVFGLLARAPASNERVRAR